MDGRFYGPQNGMVIEHHGGGGPSAFAWTVFAILLIILLVALVSLVLDFYHRSNRPGTPLQLLDERYARGELSREDYLRARGDLGGPAAEATTEVTPPATTGNRRTPPATAS